jgi:alpha-1,2-mannosyltransferase
LALATGSLLATPYVLDYDLVVLAVAIAIFVRHGMSRGFRTFTGIPLGLLMMPAVYVFTLRRSIVSSSAWLPAAMESRKRDLSCLDVLA